VLRRHALPILLSIALAIGAGAGARAAVTPPTSYPPLFGSLETEANTVSLFPKWEGAVKRFFDESRLADEPCTSTVFNRCHLREWLAFLATLRGKAPTAQLEAVNDYLNKASYITDPVNWRVADYWSAPLEFLTKDGDCEDYAIAKYFSLRWLGWPVAALRIVVLQDLNLRVAHAILVAYLDGQALVLDNQIHRVVAASVIHHYRPIYSINEQHWWLHRM
jgi:predicted transglutaminase-like cysteine proteinase